MKVQIYGEAKRGTTALTHKQWEEAQRKRKAELTKLYLPTGTRIAQLTDELMRLGCWETMRLLQQAQDAFQKDISKIQGGK